MSKDIKTTKSGDRKRHREAMRRQPPRKPLEGNHIRVRGVRRQELDSTKLSLALWLIAKGSVEHQAPSENGATGASTQASEQDR